MFANAHPFSKCRRSLPDPNDRASRSNLTSPVPPLCTAPATQVRINTDHLKPVTHLAILYPDLGDFRRSPHKIADVWHVKYLRLNSPAFAKCARSRDFLRPSLPTNQVGRFYHMTFQNAGHERGKWPGRGLGMKLNCQIAAIAKKIAQRPHQSMAKLARVFAGGQIRRDRRIKSPALDGRIGHGRYLTNNLLHLLFLWREGLSDYNLFLKKN